jgi:hypothetical protein
MRLHRGLRAATVSYHQPSPARLAGIALAALLAAALGRAEEPKNDPKDEQQGPHDQFVRILRNPAKVPQALQTAIVRHVPQDCGRSRPTVDLVAAIHIGDSAYYQQLNGLFEKYEVVLFELVTAESATASKDFGKTRGNPLSAVQNAMTSVLDLQFQLKGVDYTPKNFVHADMSPQEFAKSMDRRGESLLQTFFRAMGYGMARQNGDGSGLGDGALLMALMSKNRPLALKRVMAGQFEDLEGQMAAINGKDGSTLITERNKKALAVLKKQIEAGKDRIAIFYGAGHMRDMQQRLKDEFALAPISTRWLTAWDLRDPAPARKK